MDALIETSASEYDHGLSLKARIILGSYWEKFGSISYQTHIKSPYCEKKCSSFLLLQEKGTTTPCQM
jgi:hypothetical protein